MLYNIKYVFAHTNRQYNKQPQRIQPHTQHLTHIQGLKETPQTKALCSHTQREYLVKMFVVNQLMFKIAAEKSGLASTLKKDI